MALSQSNLQLMSAKPKLERYKTQWIVWVDGVGSPQATPRAAIAHAASGLPEGEWCEGCAGTGVHRTWLGDDPRVPCELCEGAGTTESDEFRG